eukprot:COSAG04_NODE_394_length_15124_cov_10.557005_7_plen_311_part_00
MAPPPRRSRRLALKRITIGDLPEPALRAILLGPSDNLLRFVAACARVCAEWRRVVGGSAAYGLGLPRARRADEDGGVDYEGDDNERARVLKAITEALEREGDALYLDTQLGDAGAAALGVALQAMPQLRFTELDLSDNELTAAGVTSLVPALRRPWGDGGLQELIVHDNPLGDAGVVALTKALPHTLKTLWLSATDCDNDGLVALAAALPALTRLRELYCCRNPAATARGWVALAGALPSLLPALQILFLHTNEGMGSEGGAALAAAVPSCPRLRELHAFDSQLAEEDRAKLRALSRPPGDPAGYLYVGV